LGLEDKLKCFRTVAGQWLALALLVATLQIVLKGCQKFDWLDLVNSLTGDEYCGTWITICCTYIISYTTLTNETIN
jgi:hypothetical protein